MELTLLTRILFYFHLLSAVGASVRIVVARAATKHDAVIGPPVRGRPAAAARASCCGIPVRRCHAEGTRCRMSPCCCSRLCCGYGLRLLVYSGSGLRLLVHDIRGLRLLGGRGRRLLVCRPRS